MNSKKVIPTLTLMVSVGLASSAGVLLGVTRSIPQVQHIDQVSSPVSVPPVDVASDTVTPSDIYGKPVTTPVTQMPAKKVAPALVIPRDIVVPSDTSTPTATDTPTTVVIPTPSDATPFTPVAPVASPLPTQLQPTPSQTAPTQVPSPLDPTTPTGNPTK